MKDLRVNALANMMLRVFNIVFPLITGPYLARILDVGDYGEFNIVDTIVTIFIPFATLGVYNFGIREISKVKDNIEKRNKVFSQLFYLSLVATLLTTAAYALYVTFLVDVKSWGMMYAIMGIQILAQGFYIEWMNEAFENYTFILYKTLFIRVVMLVSIFMFVKQPHDIVIYAAIMSLTTFGNYLLSFIWIKKDVRLVKVPLQEFKPLFKPMIAIFLLANASMLYTYMDRLFLAQTGVPEYVSYYTFGQKLAMLLAGVISGAVSVSVPRLSYYIGQNNYQAYTDLVNKGSRFFTFFLMPISMGMAVIGTYVTVIYYGDK